MTGASVADAFRLEAGVDPGPAALCPTQRIHHCVFPLDEDTWMRAGNASTDLLHIHVLWKLGCNTKHLENQASKPWVDSLPLSSAVIHVGKLLWVHSSLMEGPCRATSWCRCSLHHDTSKHFFQLYLRICLNSRFQLKCNPSIKNILCKVKSAFCISHVPHHSSQSSAGSSTPVLVFYIPVEISSTEWKGMCPA